MRRLAGGHAVEIVLVLLDLLADPPPVVLEDRFELLVGGQGLRVVASMAWRLRFGRGGDNLIHALARAGKRVGVDSAAAEASVRRSFIFLL